MLKNNTVALYCRTEKRNMAEIERQRNKLWDYCNSNDYDIYCAYLDNGFDIYAMRPQYNNMINDIIERKINLVLVCNLDIITTSTKVLREIFKLLKDYNCNLISLEENYNYKEDYKEFRNKYSDKDKLSSNILYDFEDWGQMCEEDWGVIEYE